MYFGAGTNNTFEDLIFNATNTGGQSITLQYATTISSVTINASGEQSVNMNNNVMTIDDFTLNYSKNTIITPDVFIGGNKTFTNTFTINSSGTLKVSLRTHGNNTFNVFYVGNRMDRWEIQANTTQTITDLKPIIGTCEQPILITSSSLGTQGTISQASGTVTGDYLHCRTTMQPVVLHLAPPTLPTWVM
ncbi:MAG: hypothetical protein R2778_17960 [Saprospiraceae bacterium]